eukprot:365279-Chlamydomonas_euryale.AAC.10
MRQGCATAARRCSHCGGRNCGRLGRRVEPKRRRVLQRAGGTPSREFDGDACRGASAVALVLPHLPFAGLR